MVVSCIRSELKAPVMNIAEDVLNLCSCCFYAVQAKAYADNFKWKGPVPEYE